MSASPQDQSKLTASPPASEGAASSNKSSASPTGGGGLSFKDRMRKNATPTGRSGNASPKYMGSPSSRSLNVGAGSASPTLSLGGSSSPPPLSPLPSASPEGVSPPGGAREPTNSPPAVATKEVDAITPPQNPSSTSNGMVVTLPSVFHSGAKVGSSQDQLGLTSNNSHSTAGDRKSQTTTVLPPPPSPPSPPIRTASVSPSTSRVPGLDDSSSTLTPSRNKPREKLFSPPQPLRGVSVEDGDGVLSGSSTPQAQQNGTNIRVGGVLPPALQMQGSSAFSQDRDGNRKRSNFSSLLVPSTPINKDKTLFSTSASFSNFEGIRSPPTLTSPTARDSDDAIPFVDEEEPTSFADLVRDEHFAESAPYVLQCERAGGIDPSFVVSKHQPISVEEEYERYAHGPTAQTDGDNDGECDCSQEHITKDMRGFDYSKYQTHELFHSCAVCKRRPATFLCVETFEAVCASHVEEYYIQKNRDASPNKKFVCSLYINILDIMTSFDRIFWCERCKRFTWKYTEVYEPLTDQLAFSKGTYLSDPVLDIAARQYHTSLGADRPSKSLKNLRAFGASVQGWRSGQEDAEAAFTVSLGKGSSHPMAVYCVFDGHGGDAVARLAGVNIERFTTMAATKKIEDAVPTCETISSQEIQTYFNDLFTEALVELDKYIQNTHEGVQGDYNCVGCTACIVGITKDFIVCANVGDSGAAIFDDHKLTMLSTPHRLTDSVEIDRVKKAGYSIADGRIEGLLAVPRALGDYDFKQCGGMDLCDQAVSPSPDVKVVPIPGCSGVTSSTIFSPQPQSQQQQDGTVPPSPALSDITYDSMPPTPDHDNSVASLGGGQQQGSTTPPPPPLPPSSSTTTTQAPNVVKKHPWGVVLACDGVWDTIDAQEVHSQITTNALVKSDPFTNAEELPNAAHDDDMMSATCLDKQQVNIALGLTGRCVSLVDDPEGNGMDNVSVMIVFPEFMA